MRTASFAIFGLLLLSACDNGGACTLGSTEGCDDGQACEMFPDGTAQCTSPLYVQGRIFDLETDNPIADARIVALDINGAARSGVAFSAADGTYELQVSVPRTESGDPDPSAEAITLRVDAADYETFPKAPRQALPIEFASATMTDNRYVVMNSTTDVGLLPLMSGTGNARIDGVVQADDPGGVLVVAEQGGVAVSTSITASDGAFTLYNVPAGSTTITGYRAGLYAATITVDQTAGGLSNVILTGTTEGLGTVTGDINPVNPGSAISTVILVVESTFNELTGKGEAPAGLRANMVSDTFVIEQVPPGNYVVLAAFENDDFVRDPDTSIGGTDTLHITVNGGTTEAGSFKITGAMAVISPGANMVETVTASPTFAWEDDSSEQGYHFRLFDAYGVLVHEDLCLPDYSGGGNPTYTLPGTLSSGASLTTGTIYQFRVFSYTSDDSTTPCNGTLTYLSSTEDLKGIFLYDGP